MDFAGFGGDVILLRYLAAMRLLGTSSRARPRPLDSTRDALDNLLCILSRKGLVILSRCAPHGRGSSRRDKT